MVKCLVVHDLGKQEWCFINDKDRGGCPLGNVTILQCVYAALFPMERTTQKVSIPGGMKEKPIPPALFPALSPCRPQPW